MQQSIDSFAQHPVASPPKGWEPTDVTLATSSSQDFFHILRSQCEELSSMWTTNQIDIFLPYEVTGYVT